MSNLPLELLTNESLVRGSPRGQPATALSVAREAGIVRSGKGVGRYTRVLNKAALTVLALGLLGVGLAQTVVTIGFSMPLTGAAAKEGTESQVGAQLAATVIEEAGGFQVGDETVTFKIVFEDDQCNPQAAID